MRSWIEHSRYLSDSELRTALFRSRGWSTSHRACAETSTTSSILSLASTIDMMSCISEHVFSHAVSSSSLRFIDTPSVTSAVSPSRTWTRCGSPTPPCSFPPSDSPGRPRTPAATPHSRPPCAPSAPAPDVAVSATPPSVGCSPACLRWWCSCPRCFSRVHGDMQTYRQLLQLLVLLCASPILIIATLRLAVQLVVLRLHHLLALVDQTRWEQRRYPTTLWGRRREGMSLRSSDPAVRKNLPGTSLKEKDSVAYRLNTASEVGRDLPAAVNNTLDGKYLCSCSWTATYNLPFSGQI